MISFQSERPIRATRKAHSCCSCGTEIPARSQAVYYSAKDDGELIDGYYHIECRAAEIAWNSERDTWGEDWDALSGILGDEDRDHWLAWLRAEHPIAAERIAPCPK